MTISQKISTVANNDTAVNDEITLQAEDGWVVFSLTLSGTDIILLFQKIITEA